MAFIEKSDPVVLNIKLTTKGRELLSTGNLNFKYFAIGDSEIDYQFNNDTGLLSFDSIILRPADNNPNIISFIPRNISGDPYNVIPSVPTSWYPVVNNGQSIGFFDNVTGNTFTFNADPNHVKQGGCMIDMSTVIGGTSLAIKQSSNYIPPNEPSVDDFLLVKWTVDGDTTPFVTSKLQPTPFLIYKIAGIISGSLSADNLVVSVDRNLPDFGGLATGRAGAIVYYGTTTAFSGNTILDDTSIDYLDESVLSFLSNSKCPTVIFPFWNMSIIFTEEIAGVKLGDKTYGQFKTAPYGGFVSYIQSQEASYKKLGVIHYTNASPANVYAEGFYQNTAILDVPTIMWHKSSGSTLGARFIAGNGSTLVNLGIHYYDLVDASNPTIVVGKIFDELKLFLIEDQELLYAMSYKSNRSWTLPAFQLAGGGSGGCVPVPPTPETLFVQTIIGQAGSIKNTGGQNISGFEKITEYGVEYKLATLPDVPANWTRISRTTPLLVNNFSIDINDTTPNTAYNYRSYVKIGNNEYIDTTSNFSITTLPAVVPSPPAPSVVIPSVHTAMGVEGIGQINNTGGNEIIGYASIEKYGMEYKRSIDADVPTNWALSPAGGMTGPLGTGNFSANITGLAQSTSYDYRAYIQVAGVVYRSGTIQTTTTTAEPAPQYYAPEVATGIAWKQLSNKTTGLIDVLTKANNVSYKGGAAITEYGILYSQVPANNSPAALVYGGTGILKVSTIGDYPDVTLPFAMTITGTIGSTSIYFRVFALNSAGLIGYGDIVVATTIPVVVVPTTNTIFMCGATTPANPLVTSAISAKIGVSSPLGSGESIVLHLTHNTVSDTVTDGNDMLLANIRAEAYYTVGSSTVKNNLACSNMKLGTQNNCTNSAYSTLTITSSNINSICLHTNAYSASKNASYQYTNCAKIIITEIENVGGANYSLSSNTLTAENTTDVSGIGGGELLLEE